VAGIVNFAHGELFMVAAYALYVAQAKLALPYPLAAVAAVGFMMFFGVLFYGMVVRPVVAAGGEPQLCAPPAAAHLLVNLTIVLAGSLPKTVHSPLVEIVLDLGGVRFSLQRVLILACTVLSFAGLYLFLKHAKWGKAMRALAQNRSACVAMGIPVHRT